MPVAANAGALVLPVPAVVSPGTGVANQAPSDPALDALILYFGALWSAYCGAAWLGANPNEPITKTLLKHNPEEEDFTDGAVPALYMWRGTQERAISRGDEFEVSACRFEILWVMPMAPTIRKAARAPWFNAWSKIMQHAAKGEPDINWIASGDIKVSSLAYGTPILDAAGLVEMGFIEATTKELRVDIEGGAAQTYPCFGASISAQEETVLKVDQYPQGGLDLKLHTADGLRLTEHAIKHKVSRSARAESVTEVSGKISLP